MKLTAKAIFEIRLRHLIGVECRRRKTGRSVVFWHVERVVREMRRGG